MNQPYFTLEFAQSIHGGFKRIQVSQRTVKCALCSIALLSFVVIGLVSGCLWMGWKISKYEALRTDFDHLRNRYQQLQKVSKQRGEQMASLETLASEVSVAYGLNGSMPASESGPMDSDNASTSAKESIEEFNFLKAASYSGIYHRYAYQWQSHGHPSAWPLSGVITSSFGERSDPFSGEGVFHTGIDLSAPKGTPVRATADGVVIHADWSGQYGKLVVVDHGNGLQTYYAHLSQCLVIPDEEVRLGEVLARSGSTGRATAAHLHYEVRIKGTPVNPYRYMAKTQIAQAGKTTHSDLGL